RSCTSSAPCGATAPVWATTRTRGCCSACGCGRGTAARVSRPHWSRAPSTTQARTARRRWSATRSTTPASAWTAPSPRCAPCGWPSSGAAARVTRRCSCGATCERSTSAAAELQRLVEQRLERGPLLGGELARAAAGGVDHDDRRRGDRAPDVVGAEHLVVHL